MASSNSPVFRILHCGAVGLAIVSAGWESASASELVSSATAPVRPATVPADSANSESVGIVHDLLANPLGKPFNWESAAYARLRALGPKAAGVVPMLVARANDPNPTVRTHVLSALAAVRLPAAVPTLVAALEDPSPNIVLIAKGGLIDLGPAAIPALENSLNSPEARGWKPALIALSEIEPEGYAVLMRAADSHRDLSLRAEAIRRSGEMVPALAQRLHGKDPTGRNNAAQRLMQKGPGATRSLLQLLSDPDLYTRRVAADSIGRQLDAAGKSPMVRVAMAGYAKDLIAALSNPDPVVGNTLGQGLTKFPEGRDALAAAASASDPRARAAATRWLGSTGPIRADSSSTTRPASADIAALVRALADPEAPVRVAAAQALGQAHQKSTIDPLTRALLDADPDVRLAAGGALLGFGADGADGLASGLRNSDARIRMQSAQVLGDLGPGVAAAVTPLLSDPNIDVRRAATKALYLAYDRGSSGPPSPAQRESIRLRRAALKELLTDADPQTQSAAAMLLQIGGVAEADDLAGLLRSNDPKQRRVALQGLLPLPPEQLGIAVEPLAEVVRSDPANRSLAAQVLGSVGPSASARIFELLASPDPGVRLAMQSVLGRHATSVELLRKMLRDTHPPVRAALLELMPGLGAREEAALLDAMKDADPRFRAAAAGPLGNDRSAPARAGLRDAAKDADATVRAAVASALDPRTEKDQLIALGHDSVPAVRAAAVGRLVVTLGNNPTSPLPVFLAAMQDGDEAVRAAGAEGVAKTYSSMRRDPRKPKMPAELSTAMENAIRDKAIGVRAVALKSLVKDPAAAEAFLPTLLAILKDSGDPHRPAVLPVVAVLARNHPPALSALLAALSDHDDAVREAAASAFVTLDQAALAVLPPDRDEARKHLAELAALTTDGNPRVRIAAALALLTIQPGHPAAGPVLVGALKDKDSVVRLAAIDSLWRVPLQMPGVRPALLAMLDDPDPRMLAALMQSLSMCPGVIGHTNGPDPAPWGLINSDAATRRATVDALGAAGAASLESAGRLLEVANNDADPDVRRAATSALRKILTAAIQKFGSP